MNGLATRSALRCAIAATLLLSTSLARAEGAAAAPSDPTPQPPASVAAPTGPEVQQQASVSAAPPEASPVPPSSLALTAEEIAVLAPSTPGSPCPCTFGYACLQGQCILPVPPKRPNLTDGVYLRFGAGVGLLGGAAKPSGGPRVDLSGVVIPFELAIGGSPAPGLSMGAGFYGAVGPNLDASVGGSDFTAAFLRGIGSFFDLHPNSTRGFHVQGAITYTMVSLKRGQSPGSCGDQPGACSVTLPATDYDGAGFGLRAGIGFEGFVGRSWNVGVLAQVEYVSAALEAKDAANPDVHLTLAIPAILVTVTRR